MTGQLAYAGDASDAVAEQSAGLSVDEAGPRRGDDAVVVRPFDDGALFA